MWLGRLFEAVHRTRKPCAVTVSLIGCAGADNARQTCRKPQPFP
jgi:hypothetical protein